MMWMTSTRWVAELVEELEDLAEAEGEAFEDDADHGAGLFGGGLAGLAAVLARALGHVSRFEEGVGVEDGLEGGAWRPCR